MFVVSRFLYLLLSCSTVHLFYFSEPSALKNRAFEQQIQNKQMLKYSQLLNYSTFNNTTGIVKIEEKKDNTPGTYNG